jgi:hypothetical protein
MSGPGRSGSTWSQRQGSLLHSARRPEAGTETTFLLRQCLRQALAVGRGAVAGVRGQGNLLLPGCFLSCLRPRDGCPLQQRQEFCLIIPVILHFQCQPLSPTSETPVPASRHPSWDLSLPPRGPLPRFQVQGISAPFICPHLSPGCNDGATSCVSISVILPIPSRHLLSSNTCFVCFYLTWLLLAGQ